MERQHRLSLVEQKKTTRKITDLANKVETIVEDQQNPIRRWWCSFAENGIDFLVDFQPNIKIGFFDALAVPSIQRCYQFTQRGMQSFPLADNTYSVAKRLTRRSSFNGSK